MTKPVFAVVGHPNKGKSSIVATLARQDAVKISSLSGTTTQAQAFTLNVDGQTLYSLVDTPGFQRPRQVLSWLEQHCQNASQRPDAIRQFIDAHQATTEDSRFHDETELLRPITEGAGIIYVVDGSVPYTPEYEAEMTILQWSGQPRMALINPIGGEQFVAQWQQALSQFFSVVRVFDPMTADDQKQVAILSAFAELSERWRSDLERAIQVYSAHLQRLRSRSAKVIIESMQQLLQLEVSLPVPEQFAETALRQQLQQRYQQTMRDLEANMQRQLQELYALNHMRLNAQTLDFPDMFDVEHWYLFGLDRQKLVALSASAGAAAGAVVDVGLGGSSLMMGALAGGIVTGAASLLATWKPEKLKVKGVPLAGKTLTMGPVKDANFSFVLLGRAIDFFDLVARRTHADRRVVTMAASDFKARMASLNQVEQVKLTRALLKARKGLSEQDSDQLQQWLLQLMAAGQQ